MKEINLTELAKEFEELGYSKAMIDVGNFLLDYDDSKTIIELKIEFMRKFKALPIFGEV